MMTNYCRLCMAEDDLELIDAFTRDAIHNEFSIVIRTNDELSKEICKKCGKFILKMVDFKRNVVNVQKVLNKVVKKEKTKIGIEQHVTVTESPTTSTFIDIKDENDVNQDEEGSSVRKDVPTNPESSKKRKIKSRSLLKRKKVKVKTESLEEDDTAVEPSPLVDSTISIDDDDIEKKTNPYLYPCKFCSATFGFIETLGFHLKKHHDGHLCTKCGYISVSAKSYAKHLRSHYNLTYSHRVCLSCFKICNDQAEFYAHKKLVHDAGKSSFVCSDCSEEFTTLEEFENHKRRVHPATENENTQCETADQQSISVEDSELQESDSEPQEPDSELQEPDSENVVDLEQCDENLDSVNEEKFPENTNETEPDEPPMEIPNAYVDKITQSNSEEVSENSKTNCDSSQNAPPSSKRRKRNLEIPEIMDEKGRLRKPKFAKLFIPKDTFWLCRLCHRKKYSIDDLKTHFDECIVKRQCNICKKVFSCSNEVVLHKHMIHNRRLSKIKFRKHVRHMEQLKQNQEEERQVYENLSKLLT